MKGACLPILGYFEHKKYACLAWLDASHLNCLPLCVGGAVLLMLSSEYCPLLILHYCFNGTKGFTVLTGIGATLLLSSFCRDSAARRP